MPTIENTIKTTSIIPDTNKEVQKQTLSSDLAKKINKTTESTSSKKLENIGFKSTGGGLCGLAMWPIIGVATAILLTPLLPAAPLLLVTVGTFFVCGAIGGAVGAGFAIVQNHLSEDEC